MSRCFHLAHINARSVSNKINQFQNYVNDNRVDRCAIMESWLKEDVEHSTKEVPPCRCNIFSNPRSDGRQGGGIAVVYRDYYMVKQHIPNTFCSCMELSILDFRLLNTAIILFIIYRYPTTSVITFCTELAQLLESNISTVKGHSILTGDFNFHLDDMINPNPSIFRDFLDSMGLVNYVNFPTHQFRQTLDIFIEEGKNHVIMKVNRGHLLSDHHVILSWLNIDKGKPPVKTITYRKIKNLDHGSFGRDIEKLLQLWQLRNLDHLVREYNQILPYVLDTCAPLRR